LSAAKRPRADRHEDRERNIVINTRTIQQISPSIQVQQINPATGETIKIPFCSRRPGRLPSCRVWFSPFCAAGGANSRASF